jgi:hypothetical protein
MCAKGTCARGTNRIEARSFTRDEVALVLAVARVHFPERYPFVLCGLRTGLRTG